MAKKIKQLHQDAMDFAEQAQVMRINNDLDKAKKLFNKTFRLIGEKI